MLELDSEVTAHSNDENLKWELEPGPVLKLEAAHTFRISFIKVFLKDFGRGQGLCQCKTFEYKTTFLSLSLKIQI